MTYQDINSGVRKRRRGRPVGADRERTSARILKAAQQCFNAREYSEVSMADVASLAGISGPAIYTYFKSKDDLFIESAMTLMRGGLKIVSDAAECSGNWSDRLKRVIDAQRGVQSEIDAFPLIYSVVQARMVRFPDKYKAVIALRHEYSEVFCSIAGQAIDEGHLPSNTDPQIAGELLMAFTSNSIGIVRYYHQEEGDLDKIIDAVRALLGVTGRC